MRGDTIWIWGRHPVLEALRAERATSVLIAVGQRSAPVVDEILSQARSQGVAIREVDARELDAMSPGATTQGVAATVTIRRLGNVEDVLASIAPTRQEASSSYSTRFRTLTTLVRCFAPRKQPESTP